jgi:hypothetical protein
MNGPTVSAPRKINWLNVSTVVSAAILIAAEVFGAAYAGGWALSILFNLGEVGHYALQAIFFACGLAVMAVFIRHAATIETFVDRK